jgi:dTDP-4-dehydrorhamnose 3,5-epimerase
MSSKLDDGIARHNVASFKMKSIRCPLDGVLLIEPDVFGDSRGYFVESWNEARYREAGIADGRFVQDNFSYSRRGTLRGMHFQNPRPQGKLVSVWQGEVFDVVVDIRRESPTFRQWYGVCLDPESKRQLFVPAGFAHGFIVLSETALFHYKCTETYSPGDECGFRWNDPAIGIEWPAVEPILSPRDAGARAFDELPLDVLF